MKLIRTHRGSQIQKYKNVLINIILKLTYLIYDYKTFFENKKLFASWGGHSCSFAT